MMNRTALVVAATLCLAVSSSTHGKPNVEYLKEEPPAGALPYRKIVYVDDGTCPRGQVKEVTGGSQEKSILRKVRCVTRPG